MKTTDLLTVGESMLRLSAPAGHLIQDSPSFDAHVAGAESNVAVGVAHMGYQSRWLSRLTDNTLGRRIVRELSGHQVDLSGVVWTNEDRVGVSYLEFGAKPRPTRVLYDRAFSAAQKMGPESFDLEQVTQAHIVHLTGITAALSDSCYALVAAVLDKAKEYGVHVVFDVNYRSLLWTPQECAEKLGPLLKRVDTLIIGRSDAETVFGVVGDSEIVVQLQRRFGVAQIALTRGEAGAVAIDHNKMVRVPGYPVQIVDRIGAGDAFAAGVICGLLDHDFALGVKYGVAMSALQFGLQGDMFRLSKSDVTQLIESDAKDSPIRLTG